MLNKKHIVIFLALLVACMSIAVAADTADTTTADSQVSDTVEADTTNTIQTQASTNANEDNNNITKENKKIKEDTTSTIPVDNDNFDDYFTNAGLTGVNDGDTITFTSDVTRTSNSYIINKQVNILGNNYTLDLNTINGYDNQSNPTYIEFNSQASNSNISYLKFHNTQVFTTTASNITFDNNIFYNPITIGDNSNVTNNTFKSDVTLYNNINFKNNNAENSTVNVNGANCDLCNNRMYHLTVNSGVTNTRVCVDNVFINGYEGSFTWYMHSTSSELNKIQCRSVKSEGESTIIDVTEENFYEYFTYSSDGRILRLNENNLPDVVIYNINYFPISLEIQRFYLAFSNLMSVMNKNITIIGKTDITLKNAQLFVSSPCKYLELSNFNFEYNDEYTVENKGYPFELEHMNFFGGNNGAVLNNITLNYTHEYSNNNMYSNPVMIKKQTGCSFTIQNSEFNINIASNNQSTSSGINIVADNTKLINNTINVNELYAINDNSYMIGVFATNTANKLIFTNNILTVNGASTLHGLKLDSNTNNITNNNITVTTTGTATGVEINGNDNTVKDNKISANDKTGNDAVTVTGENNIVENNTASEADTRLPTSIELNYDGTPIDAGKRLVIRGTFKAGTVETYAEDIKVYDNNELIATINTIDDFGTIAYGYTPAIGGNHNITFKFNGNATHEGTSTSINVKVNGPEDTIIIREDNFYDYFNDRGELNYTKLSNNTTVYFESVPDEIEGITFDENRNTISNKTLTFVGLDGFTLTNKYVIMESTLKNFNLYNMTLVYTQEYMGSHLIISPKNENVEHYTVENVVIDLNYTDWDKENSIMPVEARGNNIVFENITLKGVVPADFINWNTGNGIRACIPIYVNGNNNLLSNIHVDLQAVNLADEFSSLYPSVAILGSNNLLTGSDIKINGTQYNYGITLTGENLTVTNNTFNITAERYSNAVVIISRSNHITIENNNINCSTTYYADGEVDKTSLNVGYCIYLEGQGYNGGKYWPGAGGINDTLIRNNSVVGSAFNIYGIEGFGNDNLTVVNNTFNLTAYYPMGIGVIGTYNNITDNIIIVKGESNNTGSSPDYIDPTTAGIILQYGENSTVYNNSISATNGSGILLRGDNRDSITSNNIVTTDYSYSIVLDGSSNNATVEDNYLETPGRLGDESVKDSGKDNVVQNNLPVVDKEYFIKVDTTEFVPGSTATISASIYYGTEYTSDVAQNISKGKVSFKVNGKTLKDANGKVIYAKVTNGTATIDDYQIPDNWNSETTIQAVYSGSSEVAKMSSEKTAITIVAREPTITTEDVTATAGSTITLTATINTDAVVNTGKVVFKINGKTVKDANGKVIYAKVSNNQVSVEYTLPDDMKTGTYNLTAVFISSEYDRLEDTKTLTVN